MYPDPPIHEALRPSNSRPSLFWKGGAITKLWPCVKYALGCSEKRGCRALENAGLVSAKIDNLKEGDQSPQKTVCVSCSGGEDRLGEGQLLGWESPLGTGRARHWKTVVLGEVS